jgi:hypothetical protein
LSSLRKSFAEIEKKLKTLSGQPVDSNGADQEAVDRCLDELQKLRTEFESHRDFAT